MSIDLHGLPVGIYWLPRNRHLHPPCPPLAVPQRKDYPSVDGWADELRRRMDDPRWYAWYRDHCIEPPTPPRTAQAEAVEDEDTDDDDEHLLSRLLSLAQRRPADLIGILDIAAARMEHRT